MTSTIIGPITETTRLYRLNPVTRLSPSAVKISPPTTAPTIPSTILRKKPAPLLLTILAAMKPAISPSTIQAIMDTANPLFAGPTSLTRGHLRFQGAGNGAGLTRSTWSSSVQGRLGAPDDLCCAGYAKDLDKTGHLVEQVPVSIVLAPFSQDDQGYETGSDFLNPAGVSQNAIGCGHLVMESLGVGALGLLDRRGEHLQGLPLLTFKGVGNSPVVSAR